MLLFINTITLIIAFLAFLYPRKENILHPKKIFLSFFMIVQVSGYFLIEIIKSIDKHYKIPDSSLLAVSIITLFSLILFLLFYQLLQPLNKLLFSIIKLPRLENFAFKKLNLIFLAIGLLGLLIYFKNSGFALFKAGGYENKNIENLGLGYARIMYNYGFVFFLVSYLATNYSKNKFRISIVLSLSIGALVFIVIGGGRASSLQLLIVTILIAIYQDQIKLTRLIFLGVGFILLVFVLTVIRYKLDFSSEHLSLFLYQFQGSFSPVDSFARIYESIPSQHDYQPSLFFNSFLTLIPRSIWVTKPIELEVPSVFFTSEILNYTSFLTISPTLLGELYIYNGVVGIIFGMFFCALLVKILSVIFQKSHRSFNMKIFILLNALYAFSLFREGISISLRDFLFFSIIFSVLSIFTEVFRILFSKPNR